MTKLVEWIQQVLDLPLDRDDEKKIMEGKFDGESSGRCWEPGLLYACWPLVWANVLPVGGILCRDRDQMAQADWVSGVLLQRLLSVIVAKGSK
jgi:hypothetical protein